MTQLTMKQLSERLDAQEAELEELRALTTRLMRNAFPADLRRPEPPAPDPGDDLLGPSPSGSERFLRDRFALLTQRTAAMPAFVSTAERDDEWETYLNQGGRELPCRYFEPGTDRLIDTDTGEEVTDTIRFQNRIHRLRVSIRDHTRDNPAAVPGIEEELARVQDEYADFQGKPRKKRRISTAAELELQDIVANI